MNKVLWILPAVALSTLAIDSLPVLSKPAANTNNKPKRSQFSWSNIFSPLFNPKPPVRAQKGVSRGDKICLFSPDLPDKETREYRIVWNTQPLFLWKGRVTEMKLHRENNENNNLWKQPFAGQQSAIYQGDALQPGQKYYWAIDNSMFVPFQVMEEAKRKQFTAELKALENQYQAQGATPEEIASAKANYFVDRKLWSDALQQAYAVDKPSPELEQLRQEIPKKLCETESPTK